MARLKTLRPALASLPPALGFATRNEAERARDKLRRQGDNLRRLYSTKRWRELRLVIIERDGWTCRQTGVLLKGKVNAPDSPVVDHIIPHRGNLALFWDETNLQAVSKEWHDSEKQRREKAAAAAGVRGGGSNP